MVLATWAGAFLVLAFFGFILLRMRVRAPGLRHRMLTRSPTHQAQVISIVDWLEDEKIVRAILDTRVATLQGLQDTLRDVEGMSAAEVQATIGLLLSHRSVRLVVASFVQKKRGIPKGEALRAMVEWAEPVKAEVMA